MAGVYGGDWGVRLRFAHEVALEIAQSQLRSQKEDLRTLRNQAALAAAISGLIANTFASIVDWEIFLGSGSSKLVMGIPAEAFFPLLCILLSLTFAIRVSTGWGTCTFELSAKWILEQKRKEKTEIEIYSKLAEDAEDYFDQNEVVITEAKDNLWWSMVFGLLQFPGWLVVIF